MSLNEFFMTERNLGKVIRWSTQNRIKEQSVADHSFHVALYSMVLSDMEISFGNSVDVEKVLRSCLVHDLEESMTGDVIHGFKYSDPELLKNMRKMGAEFYKKIVSKLPGDLPSKYEKLWEESKGDDLEGSIVEAADKIEALMYSIEEYSMGNRTFKPMIEYLLRMLGESDLKSVKSLLKEIKIPE